MDYLFSPLFAQQLGFFFCFVSLKRKVFKSQGMKEKNAGRISFSKKEKLKN